MGLRENILKILPKGLRDLIENKMQKRLDSQEERKFREECMSSGREKEFKHYQIQKKAAIDDIARMEGYLKMGLDPQRWSYDIQNVKETIPFIRPNDPEDINYRDYWATNFPALLRAKIPEGTDLRFHGTTIAKTKAILESGGIYSSVDLYEGYMASTNLSGHISTTDIDTVETSLNGWFTGMASYARSLPAGSLFVLNPRTKLDQELKAISEMENVNFYEHPEQLCGIISTPENIERIQGWLMEAGLDPNLAYTFDGFINKLELEKNNKSFDDRYHFDPEPITQNLGSEPTEDLSKYNPNINHEKDQEIK